jgi:phage-related baseplate assembly protein
MANFPEPVFFDTDEAAIIADMTAYYESLVGKKLAPAQTEQMLINAFAYRELMIRIAGNSAGKQMLVEYAVYPMLDYLGALIGVERLPAANAECTIVFTAETGHPPLVIPQGVRVQSKDGKAIFITLADVAIGTGVATKNITAQCTTEGEIGNNYLPGDISIILDPQAFISFAANSDTTNGGSNEEDDESLRERIRLAPAAFSVAGPEDAYVFFAKSAHPSIIDVAITSPEGSYVDIYVLMAGGVAPSNEIIDAVQAKVSPEKTRPLNDKVFVLAPAAINYQLQVELTLLDDAIDASVLALVNTNLAAYVLMRQTHLGIDVVRSQIVGKAQVDGVYEVNVISPSADMIIGKSQFANCTGINVSITGASLA